MEKQDRVQLFFREIGQMDVSDGVSVMTLTDRQLLRSLTVICDGPAAQQLMLRMRHVSECDHMLPETLLKLLQLDDGWQDYELQIYGIADAQYKVLLQNVRTGVSVRIRMSDAVLLSYISAIPLYIDSALMDRQATDYLSRRNGVAIPINVIKTEQLNEHLQKAITEENYRLASVIYEEIQKRNSQ